MRKISASVLFVMALLCLPSVGFSQHTPDALLGYWQGGFIKGNSFQRLEMHIFEEKGKLLSLQVLEEWHPSFGEFLRPVKVDSLGNISLGSGHGAATLTLDEQYLELVGQVEGRSPTIYIHLKKVPAPPALDYSVNAVQIPGDGVSLSGHLHLPRYNPTRTALILVGGRSCYAGETKYDLMAKVLRDYGITVLAYQKRGTGKSTGDCQTATIEDLAADVRACHAFLKQQEGGYDKIGVMGSSAGGWVMAKAQEKVDFDFMISIVGPGTSVFDQQMQSMDYGMKRYNLPKESREGLLKYTQMMFEAPATQASFDSFQALLKEAKEYGWSELLDNTDIPPSVAGIDSLWVRRHSFDPEAVLSQYTHPFLAIYGQRDWIVPYEENIAQLEACFSRKRRSLLTTHVAYDGEHGIETRARYVDLGRNQSYWHFFRISPQLTIETVNFLRRHRFIE